MKAEKAFTGARGTDSVTLLTATSAAALKTAGFDFAIQYQGSVNAAIVQAITNAGLGFWLVTYADRFDGAATVAQAHALGLPAGVTCWLDVEGISSMLPADLKAKINAWAKAVQSAGYVAGLYVGAGCPLTSQELYALSVTAYWKGLSRILDRNGQLAEPGSGWQMIQLYPTVDRAGVNVDVDVVQNDFRGRLPTWTVA